MNLKNYFRDNKNIRIWIFTISLSLFLWLTVKLQKRYETDVALPLKVINLPEKKTLKYKLPENLHISLVGKGIDLMRLGLYKSRIILDCQELPDSIVFNNLLSSNIRLELPPTVNLIPKDLISPKRLKIVIDKEMKKVVRVKPLLHVEPEMGYIVVEKKPKPDSLTIIGPRSIVRWIDFINTRKKTVRNAKSFFKETLELTPPESYNVSLSRDRVDVFVDVQRLGELLLENVPVKVKNQGRKYQVISLPSSANVVIRGGTRILSTLMKKDIEIYVDFSEYVPGEKLKARLKTDKKILSYEIQPEYFELIVLRKRR
jgi:hypothetical protein